MKLNSILFAAGLALASQSSAAVLFSDNFQTNLAQWAPNTSGVIVAAPGGGNALAFTQTIGGGDIFTANSISSANGQFHISFEYLGTCAQGQSCGGFLGFNNASGETWLAGSGPYASSNPITETGAWQTIAFNFTSLSALTLKIEDWNGATDGPTAGNAYFRSLVISGAVPEPASWMLMIVGFGLVGVSARRKAVATA